MNPRTDAFPPHDDDDILLEDWMEEEAPADPGEA